MITMILQLDNVKNVILISYLGTIGVKQGYPLFLVYSFECEGLFKDICDQDEKHSGSTPIFKFRVVFSCDYHTEDNYD